MSFLPVEFVPYIKYAAPPVIGAFIGYLTNRIAIRMLFRPLKAWRVLGIRVPMTPGVIPSKRHELAENMGEVVGDHLLTSTEVGKGLQAEKFQNHLLNVISGRVGAVLSRDLPSISEIVPDKFTNYVDLGSRVIKYHVKGLIRGHVKSDDFAFKVRNAAEHKIDSYLARNVNEVLGGREREAIYRFVETSVTRMFSSLAMESWIKEFIQEQVYGAIRQEKSINDLLPESLVEFLRTTINDQTPELLKKLGKMLSDPEVRDGIIAGVWGGIENFIVSLGPMGAMAQGFLDRETVDTKVREYLDEKKDDIEKWLSSDEFREKVALILTERFDTFCAKPLVDILDTENDEKVEQFCSQLSTQIFKALQTEKISAAVTSMIKSNIEINLDEGNVELKTLLNSFFGIESVQKGRTWVATEAVAMFRSEDTLHTIDCMIDNMIDKVLSKRIGKLTRFLPNDVCDQIYKSIQRVASDMLAKEVPGLVESLNIRRIVVEKLNSLDLLRLEGLLLSIMEEQFKYINLFGALLGFLIGCCNALLLVAM